MHADIHTAYESVLDVTKAEHFGTLNEGMEQKLVSKCAAVELVSTPGALTHSIGNDNSAYEQVNISLCKTNDNSAYERTNSLFTDNDNKHDAEVTHAYNCLANSEGQYHNDALQNVPISDSSIISD